MKFPIRGKELTNWVLETLPEVFYKLMSLRRLFICWSRSKMAKHLRTTQCYRCGRYGYISKSCKNKEVCLECGGRKYKSAKCKMYSELLKLSGSKQVLPRGSEGKTRSFWPRPRVPYACFGVDSVEETC